MEFVPPRLGAPPTRSAVRARGGLLGVARPWRLRRGHRLVDDVRDENARDPPRAQIDGVVGHPAARPHAARPTVAKCPELRAAADRVRLAELRFPGADANSFRSSLPWPPRGNCGRAVVPLEDDPKAAVSEDRVRAEVVRSVLDPARVSLRRAHLRTGHVQRDPGDRLLRDDGGRGWSRTRRGLRRRPTQGSGSGRRAPRRFTTTTPTTQSPTDGLL